MNVGRCEIGDEGAKHFTKSKYPNLKKLHLGTNPSLSKTVTKYPLQDMNLSKMRINKNYR